MPETLAPTDKIKEADQSQFPEERERAKQNVKLEK